MLASRLGIAALILIGLYGLLAVRPFRAIEPAPAAENAEVTDDLNLSLEELPTGEPAIQLNGPEGSETYVLRRLPNGDMAITRADKADDEILQEDAIEPLTSRDDQGLHLDLDHARMAAISAMEELNEAERRLADSKRAEDQNALSLLEGAEAAATGDISGGAPEAVTDDPFEAMVRSAIDRSAIPETDVNPPPARNPDLLAEPDPIRVAADTVRDDALRSAQDGLSGRAAIGNSGYEGKILMGEDFSGQDLAGMSFKRAVLTGADFTDANLTGANFAGAKLQGVYFNGANLIDANLRGISAQAAKFIDADMRRADLENANLTGADLTNADLRGAITSKLVLNGAIFQGARFDPISITGRRRTVSTLSN